LLRVLNYKEMEKNKHWVYMGQVRDYYKYSVDEKEFEGTFEDYLVSFLTKMKEIGLPHTIINDETETIETIKKRMEM